MEKFLWGSATAAYQCEGGWKEGGKQLSNWDFFCHSEKNDVNPVTGDIASDFYNRYEEDIEMLAKGNQNAYRFSISWSRILNEKGEIIPEGLEFYHRVIDTCLKFNVEPLVTLYHYDLPLPQYLAGGWENRNTIYDFEKYAEICFNAYHEKVKYWATVNEPNYETLCCYGFGNYPPNVQSIERKFKAMYHIMLASAKAITLFKQKKYKGFIGLVSDSYSIEILNDDESYKEAQRLADLFFNRSVNDVCINGEYSDDFIEKLNIEGYDVSYMLESDKAIFVTGVVDYLGLNAYDRICVKPYTIGESILSTNNTGDEKQKNRNVIKNWFEIDEDKNIPKNAWGMEMYPKSIYNLLLDLNYKYPATPIIITENGLGYYDKLIEGRIHDTYRVDFLSGYIEWIKKAIKNGVDVRGYFVWSTMDLYSWINGYEKRYGLVYVDYEHHNRRIPKDSYYWYKDFIEKEMEK
ncbi:glycoside hydrolase family 1 protein [Amedibacillus sp. YH-ame6]